MQRKPWDQPVPNTYLVDELHMASHARQVCFAGGGRPQKHGVIIRPAHKALRLAPHHSIIPLLCYLQRFGQECDTNTHHTLVSVGQSRSMTDAGAQKNHQLLLKLLKQVSQKRLPQSGATTVCLSEGVLTE